MKYKTFIGGILSRRHNLKSYRTFSDHFGRTLTYNGPVGSEGPGARPAWLQELLSSPCSSDALRGGSPPSFPAAAYHARAGKWQSREGKLRGPPQPSPLAVCSVPASPTTFLSLDTSCSSPQKQIHCFPLILTSSPFYSL